MITALKMRLLMRRFCYSVMILVQSNLANTLNEKKKLSEWFAKHDLILNNSETKIHYFSAKTIQSTFKNSLSINFVSIMELFSIIFYKIRTIFSKIFCPQFLPNESFYVIN
jgi:hypothetical protein